MAEQRTGTPENDVGRRSFLGILGWIGLGLSGLIAAIGNFLYLKPTVSYGAPSNFRVGKPEDYKVGIKQTFEREQVVVMRERAGFAAISVVCTHLGCTIRVTDSGFDCPCHGSQYDADGNVTGGPAPRPLDWFQVALAPSGELEIDKTVKVPPGTYFEA
jgi:cytochrome b6-f complex iron-sulfur subunit